MPGLSGYDYKERKIFVLAQMIESEATTELPYNMIPPVISNKFRRIAMLAEYIAAAAEVLANEKNEGKGDT
jgi:hypothetical protein